MNWLLRPFRSFGSTSLAHSLRFRLILLVLLASLPSLGLLFLTASQQRDDSIDVGQNEARRLARLIAADQSTVSDQIELVLSTKAQVSEDPAACTRELKRLTSPTSEPIENGSAPDLRVESASFETVLVVNEAGETLCAASPGEGRLSDQDRALAEAALATGQFVSGNYRISQTGSMIVTYAVPVQPTSTGERRAILTTVNVYALTTFAREANMPDDSFIVVFNSDGILEQRWPAAGPGIIGVSLEGTPIVDETIGVNAADETDEDRQAALEDSGFVYGSDNFWTPGPRGGVTATWAVVGVPEAVVVQSASEKFNQNLGKLGIAAVVALIAAWIGADLFVGRDSETRKGQIRDYYHAYSTGVVSELDEVVGPGYVDRTAAPGQAPGIDGLRHGIGAFRAAFPDGQVIVRELLADRDKVVARVTLSGTHVAEYYGMPPIGKLVVADGVETFRFANGMVVESWSMFGEMRPRKADAEPTPVAPPEKRGFLRRLFRRKPKTPKGEKQR